jgi:hypothetical protein
MNGHIFIGSTGVLDPVKAVTPAKTVSGNSPSLAFASS